MDQAAPPKEVPRVRVDCPAPGVARVTLARADKRNAQDARMLYELDGALMDANADDEIKAIVIAADGPDFSSGHDLADRADLSSMDLVTEWRGFAKPCPSLVAV